MIEKIKILINHLLLEEVQKKRKKVYDLQIKKAKLENALLRAQQQEGKNERITAGREKNT